jgi:hypothetical protein
MRRSMGPVLVSCDYEMIDVEKYQPLQGERVLALSPGGTLIPCDWDSDVRFEAWCPYPRVPASVKKRIAAAAAAK